MVLISRSVVGCGPLRPLPGSLSTYLFPSSLSPPPQDSGGLPAYYFRCSTYSDVQCTRPIPPRIVNILVVIIQDGALVRGGIGQIYILCCDDDSSAM